MYNAFQWETWPFFPLQGRWAQGNDMLVKTRLGKKHHHSGSLANRIMTQLKGEHRAVSLATTKVEERLDKKQIMMNKKKSEHGSVCPYSGKRLKTYWGVLDFAAS